MTGKKIHRAGYISILGKPNAGKSTLLNALLGERLSIITHKAQTTRHRILGILNGDDYQAIFSDTPGILKPSHKLHESMMQRVDEVFGDSDIFLYVSDITEALELNEYIEKVIKSGVPVLGIISKIDLSQKEEVEKRVAEMENIFGKIPVIPVCAKKDFQIKELKNYISFLLPEHPPYYDKDQITDRSERFVAAEMIREKILMIYKEEIPYSIEVVVDEFKEEEKIIRMNATIYVMRESQKRIVIGTGGEMLKRVGTKARESMEKFFAKKIMLTTFVKVKEDWRNDDRMLKAFGYIDE